MESMTLTFISVIFILILICCLIYIELSKSKKELQLLTYNNEQTKEKTKLLELENESLKNQIHLIEQKKINYLLEKSIETKSEPIQLIYKPIYKGKKAIIGSYNIEFALLLKKQLNSLGLFVDLVLTGDEVLNRIKNNNHYDIVFTNSIYQEGDIHTGYDLLNTLKNDIKYTSPIIVHSIYNTQEKFLADGFDSYLAKPSELDTLKVILKKYLS